MTRDYVRRSAASDKSSPAKKSKNSGSRRSTVDQSRRGSSRTARSSSRSGNARYQNAQSRKRAGTRQKHSTTWSAPSFSAGMVFGAALILLASYAPSAFEETVVAVRERVTEPAEDIEFNFPDMLKNDSVLVDPSIYDGQFTDEDPNAPAPEFMIQVASLKSYGAASNLTAELDSTGLSARFERVVLDQVTWYRVMVGPFPGRQEANRVMTALRKRNNMGPGGPRLIKSG